MEDADDEDKALAERLFAEVEQAGAPVTIALPALLHIKPDLRDEVVRKVADDVTSGNRGRARAAAHGIYLWTEHARQGGIAPPPGHLLDKLINRSLSRNPAALDSVLSGLRDLLHYYPKVFSERQLDAVDASLEDLLEDTKLHAHGAPDRESQLSAPLLIAWKPDLRWRAAQLAYRLSRAYASRDDVSPPDILRRWKQACREDTLPEVRAAWKL
jgi:hypothetical protein